jgi:Cytochrome c oxidase subunit IV
MLLRSLPRAGQRTSTCTIYLSPSRRTANLKRSFHSTARAASAVFDSSQQRHYAAPTTTTTQQSRSAHAISNPTLAGIEKRWEGMPPQEQATLWMQLRDRMKVDWHEMTLQEKKAGMLKSYTQGIALNVMLMHLQLA